jgi:hypothetical protein
VTNSCPCCDVSVLPHREGCTLHEDCPDFAVEFDEWAELRARIAELEARVVKLPRFFEEELDGFEHGHNAMLRSVRERLGAAGVKWEEE